MRKYVILAIIICCIASACSKVPVSGRKQFNFLPESQLTSLALDQYRTFMKDARVVNNTQDAKVVKQLGQRIAGAVESYLKKTGNAKMVKNFKWEFNVVDDPTVNAWAMPGGKVAIYTGILPVAQTETGLAVVMGHEVAHAVARHGGERMSQGLMQQLGAVGLAVALRNKPAQTQSLFMQAYGVGSSVGMMLPFGRKQETEADELGLIFMAMAGYDPSEAPNFWKRMSAKSGGQAPPEFLSTHPSHSTRVKNLQKFLTKARKYYNPAMAKKGEHKFTTQPTPKAKKPTTNRPTTQKPRTNTGGKTPRKTNTGTNRTNTGGSSSKTTPSNSGKPSGGVQGKVKGKIPK